MVSLKERGVTTRRSLRGSKKEAGQRRLTLGLITPKKCRKVSLGYKPIASQNETKECRKVSLGHKSIASQNETKECQKVSLEHKCTTSQSKS